MIEIWILWYSILSLSVLPVGQDSRGSGPMRQAGSHAIEWGRESPVAEGSVLVSPLKEMTSTSVEDDHFDPTGTRHGCQDEEV